MSESSDHLQRWCEVTEQTDDVERAAGIVVRGLPTPELLTPEASRRIWKTIEADRSPARARWAIALAASLLVVATVASAAQLGLHRYIINRFEDRDTKRQSDVKPAIRTRVPPSAASKSPPTSAALAVASTTEEHRPTERAGVSGPAARANPTRSRRIEGDGERGAGKSFGTLGRGTTIESALLPASKARSSERQNLSFVAAGSPAKLPSGSSSDVRSAAIGSASPTSFEELSPRMQLQAPQEQSQPPRPTDAIARPLRSGLVRAERVTFTTEETPGHFLAAALEALRVRGSPADCLAILDQYTSDFGRKGLAHEAFLVRIEALLSLKRDNEALRLLDDSALANVAASSRLLVTRGTLRAAADRCPEAIRDFDRVLANAGKTNGRALLGRASCRDRLGDHVGARADRDRYRQKLRSAPDLQTQLGPLP